MLNQVILIGRIAHDIVIRHTNSGTPVITFDIAVNQSYGENQKADFIECTAWGQTAEFIHKYFGKGKLIVVNNGVLHSDLWEDSEGKKHKKMYVNVKSVGFGGE